VATGYLEVVRSEGGSPAADLALEELLVERAAPSPPAGQARSPICFEGHLQESLLLARL
jgi:hypothetical protein